MAPTRKQRTRIQRRAPTTRSTTAFRKEGAAERVQLRRELLAQKKAEAERAAKKGIPVRSEVITGTYKGRTYNREERKYDVFGTLVFEQVNRRPREPSLIKKYDGEGRVLQVSKYSGGELRRTTSYDYSKGTYTVRDDDSRKVYSISSRKKLSVTKRGSSASSTVSKARASTQKQETALAKKLQEKYRREGYTAVDAANLARQQAVSDLRKDAASKKRFEQTKALATQKRDAKVLRDIKSGKSVVFQGKDAVRRSQDAFRTGTSAGVRANRKLYREALAAQKRLDAGKGTSADLFLVTSKDGKTANLFETSSKEVKRALARQKETVRRKKIDFEIKGGTFYVNGEKSSAYTRLYQGNATTADLEKALQGIPIQNFDMLEVAKILQRTRTRKSSEYRKRLLDSLESQYLAKQKELSKRLGINSESKLKKFQNLYVTQLKALGSPYSTAKLAADALYLTGQINRVKQIPKGALTLSDYNAYNRKTLSLPSGKTLASYVSARIKSEKNKAVAKGLGKYYYDSQVATLKGLVKLKKFGTKSAEVFVRATIRDLTALAKFAGKTYENVVKDTLSIVAKGAGFNNKLGTPANPFYKRTRAQFGPVVKGTVTAVNFAKKNPELVIIGATVLLAAGVEGLAKLAKKRPSKIVGEVASFFVTGGIITKAPKAVAVSVRATNKAAQKTAQVSGKALLSLHDELISTSRAVGKKAQARAPGKRRLSKASLRRAAQGLPVNKKQGMSIQGNEIVFKAPKKKGVEQSIRVDIGENSVSLVNKGRNAKFVEKISQNNGKRKIETFVQVGKGTPITLGKKGFRRPTSQIRSKRDLGEQLSIISESGVLNSVQKSLIRKASVTTRNIVKNAAFKESQGIGSVNVIQRTLKEKKLSPAKRKRLQKQLARERAVEKKGAQGRESVRQKIIARMKKQKQAMDEAKKETKAVSKGVSSSLQVPKTSRGVVITNTGISRSVKSVNVKTVSVSKQMKSLEADISKVRSALVEIPVAYKRPSGVINVEARVLSVTDFKIARMNKILAKIETQLVKTGKILSQATSVSYKLGLGLAQGISTKIGLIQAQSVASALGRVSSSTKKYASLAKKVKAVEKTVRKVNSRRKTVRVIKGPKLQVRKTPSGKVPGRGKVPKKPKKPKKTPPRKIKLPELKLTWDSKVPKGYVRVVQMRYKRGGKIVTLPQKTTPLRARKFMDSKVDRSLSASFDLKIVGIKKGRDIRYTPSSKFRAKRSKGSSVLPIVEKRGNRLDTRGEVKGIKLEKLLKPRRPRKTKVVKKKRVSKKRIAKKKRTTKR